MNAEMGRHGIAPHLMNCLAVAICLCVPSGASAHHSHPLFYDWCTTLTIDGQVTRIEWKNPHSMIDVATPDGTTYHVEWMSAQNLARQFGGSAPAVLTIGAHVVVLAHPMRDAADIRASFPDWTGSTTPNLVDPAQIRRADNTFNWAPQASTPPSHCSAK